MDQDPTFLIKMKSGFAHLGGTQFLPGYCLLFSDPEVGSLNDINLPQRAEFLLDMGLIGDAIMAVCKPVRINYGLLGNSYPSLHAHLFPRYSWEAQDQQKKNVWRYEDRYWTDTEYQFDLAKHGTIKKQLIEALQDLIKKVY